MTRVLIAPLGESPVVVTGMVRALAEQPDPGERVIVEKVVVLHPNNEMARRGVALIEDVVGTGRVRQRPLKGGDVGTREATYEFLAALQETLDGYRGEDDDVYVSCAGGRKSMSALAAAVTQFHPRVRGLYHLLDRGDRGDSRCEPSFYTIDQLGGFSTDRRRLAMEPRPDCLDLIRIPFQSLGDMGPIREQMARGLAAQPALLDMTSLEAQFRRAVVAADQRQPGMSDTSIEPILDIAFTPRAREQFKEVRARSTADLLWAAFLQMRFPHLLREHTAPDPSPASPGPGTHAYSAGPGIHIHYRTEPATQDQDHPLRKVVVTALHYPDQPRGNIPSAGADATTALFSLGDLRTIDGMLIATLGTAPMVVTQTLTLLAKRGVRIKGVGLVYPDDDTLKAGAEMIERACQDEGVEMAELRGAGRIPVQHFRIEGYDDVNSTEACLACGRTIRGAMETMQRLQPDSQIHLSISGGRKAMVAMAYYVAQLVDLPYVWHTVIADDALDDDIRADTALDKLEDLRSDAELASYLFLRRYEDRIGRFSLFEIPVVANPSIAGMS